MVKVRLTQIGIVTSECFVYSFVEAMGVLLAHYYDYQEAQVIDERGFSVHFERKDGEQDWRLVP